MKLAKRHSPLGRLRPLACALLLLAGGRGMRLPAAESAPPPAPAGLVARAGDRSVALHWDPAPPHSPVAYEVSRAASSGGPFLRLNAQPVRSPSWADLEVENGRTYRYRVRGLNAAGDGAPSEPVQASPRPFENDEEFLSLVEQTAFDYFWCEANPENGLVKDRSTPDSPCSIAATGFGLTALGIGIDHGWIGRSQGRDRALAALRTFWDKPQGEAEEGAAGHRGWYYHFLDLRTGARVWRCELSSIDTALLLAGALYARQYFDGEHPREREIRELAEALYRRVDWSWMTHGQDSLTMGWKPGSGFLEARWIGYNEASLLYVLGLGASRGPLGPEQWSRWVSGYAWTRSGAQGFVSFPPLFGHQYSQCWLDLRSSADGFMRDKGLTYFENSRRATLAQREYCLANPGGWQGYSSNVWGLTACDGPGRGRFLGYSARGAPPAFNDDGTLAPTAAGGSLPFCPEVCVPALRAMYDLYRPRLWCAYGFRDAFNLSADWWDPDVLGIDQGAILLMAENRRSQGVWRVFMRNPEVRRGLERAGFKPVAGPEARGAAAQ